MRWQTAVYWFGILLAVVTALVFVFLSGRVLPNSEISITFLVAGFFLGLALRGFVQEHNWLRRRTCSDFFVLGLRCRASVGLMLPVREIELAIQYFFDVELPMSYSRACRVRLLRSLVVEFVAPGVRVGQRKMGELLPVRLLRVSWSARGIAYTAFWHQLIHAVQYDLGISDPGHELTAWWRIPDELKTRWLGEGRPSELS